MQMSDFCGILSSSSLLYVFPLCPPLVGFHFSNFVYFLLVLPLSVHGDTVCKPYQFSQSVSCSILGVTVYIFRQVAIAIYSYVAI